MKNAFRNKMVLLLFILSISTLLIGCIDVSPILQGTTQGNDATEEQIDVPSAKPQEKQEIQRAVAIPARITDHQAAEDMRKLAQTWFDTGDGITKEGFEELSGILASDKSKPGVPPAADIHSFHYPDGNSIISITDRRDR